MRPRSILSIALVLAGLFGNASAQPTPPGEAIPQDIPPHVRVHIQNLRSPRQEERAAAAQALGLLGNQSSPAVPYLVALLGDGPAVDAKVVEALGRIGEPAVAPLISVMTTAEENRRTTAAQALGKIGRPAVKPLMDALPHDLEPVRTDLARALAMVGRPAVDLLIPGIMDKNVHIRWGSTIALGDIKDPRAVEPLVQGLKDKTWNSRMCTAMALGRIGDPRAVEPLIEEMNDQSWPLRWSATRALGEIGGVRAVESLLRLLSDSDANIRQEASQALGKLGGTAVPTLLEALKSEDGNVRQAAAGALGVIKDPRAAEPLRKHLAGEKAKQRVEEVKAANAVLDTAGLWRCHYTLRPPVVRKGDVLENVSLSVKWLTRDTPPPPPDWMTPDFDDGSWTRTAAVPMDYRGEVGPLSPLLALECRRGRFLVTDPAAAENLKLSIAYHGGVIVYLNGREIVRGHLPAEGEVEPGALADPYPPEATEDAAARIRKLDDVPVPASALRRGVNVLAIELHRAPYGEKDVGKDQKGRLTVIKWGTCGLVSVRLWAGTSDGIVPNVARPEGLQVWNSDPLAPDFDLDWGDPGEPIRPIRLVGTPGGAFSGKVVVGSAEPIRGLRAFVTALVRENGPGVIPPGVIQVRYATPYGSEYSAYGRYATTPGRLDALLETPLAEVPVTTSKPNWQSRKAPGQPRTVFGAVQPVWVTVHVPTYTPPGDYKGMLTLYVSGRETAKVPVALKVCGWKLPSPKEYHTFVEFIQSPDTLALEYDVPLWSPRHFALIERSFRILGQTGTRSVYIPLICETNLGNEQSMVRWIRKSDGGYVHDLSILDRYLHIARTQLGRLEVVCLIVWDNFLEGGQYADPKWTPKPILEDRQAHGGLGPPVTLWNPATGRIGREVLPVRTAPGSRETWGPLLEQIRLHMQSLGVRDAMMLGLVTDSTPTKEVVSFFKELLPDVPWVRHSHGVGRDLHGVPFGYWSTVWGCRFVGDPETGRSFGWKRPELLTQFPRCGMDGFPMTTQRLMGEMNIAGHQRGFGRLGADFWSVLRNKAGHRVGRVSGGRYPKSAWRALDISSSYLAPGPDGPVPTARLEMVREGVQECEARIFIERALTDPVLRTRLGDALADRCQEMLDERTRAALRGTSTLLLGAGGHAAEGSAWWNRSGIGADWFISSGWQERSAKLFDAAAEVAGKLRAK
ncbi:MAG TPA: HEAT repeat domain-containing protein [Planctomycetota bacterium]|nr:HEAT repeat domain-containing protein [Planctomycetota bacterium]